MTGLAFAGRREDARLLSGEGRYTADIVLPGEASAVFVRSDRPHADILSIDIASAKDAPGVLAVLTAEDMIRAGARLPPPSQRPAGSDGPPVRSPEREVLASRRVLFVGQPMALVVAETQNQAQDAAEMVGVDYRDRPAVVDAALALKPGAPEVSPDVPGNLCFSYEYGDASSVDRAFADAAHLARVEVVSQRLAGNPMEPKACTVSYDEAADCFDIYCPTQGHGVTRERLAKGLGVDEGRLRFHVRDVGGAFGVRIEAYPEYLAVAVAARQLGRAVKWVSSRSETILSDYHGRDVRLLGELALDREGRFLAVRYRWIANQGAYPSSSGPIVNTVAPSIYITGPYRTPSVHGVHDVVLTNTVPTTPYRGSARPNVSYLLERLVDEAASVTGIDPVELRLRNLLTRDRFPYRNPLGATYDSGDPPALLKAAAEAIDYSHWPRRRDEAKGRGRLRGLGFAVFIESAGGGRSPVEEAAIRIDGPGDIVIHALSGASGQGHETVFPEIVATALGLPASRVRLLCGEVAGVALKGGGSMGSRSVMSHGSALLRAAESMIEKGRILAAEALEVASGDVRFEAGRYVVAGTDLSIGLDDLIRRHVAMRPHPLDADGSVAVSQTFPSGAHAAEVEIDPETGVTMVVSYVAVDDCGRAINHALVEGQIQGGVMQGYGQVFGEQVVFDSSGQLLTGSFMDYFMPRASDGHPIFVLDRSVPSPNNPLGVKGVGEAGTTGAVPALANAVLNALRPLGIRHLDLPYTPARLWTAIDAARSRR